MTQAQTHLSLATDRPWYDPHAALPIPAARDDLKCELLDDEAVLFDPATGATYRLNPTALIVWQQCKPDQTMSHIAHALSEQYDIELDHALDDVEQLIAYFANNGLLKTFPKNIA